MVLDFGRQILILAGNYFQNDSEEDWDIIRHYQIEKMINSIQNYFCSAAC